MAVVRDTAFPLADYPTGTHSFGPLNVQNNTSRIKFEVARCTTADPTIWPNAATTIELLVELSLDNGNTWTVLGGFGAEGGIYVLRTGAESTYSSYQTFMPDGNQRRLRGAVTIANGPLRSFGTLEVE